MQKIQFTTDVVIGLEIHIELDTNTKLFCGCRTKSETELPNTLTCPTCLGMPGSKPVLNKKAVEYALRLALALRCTIAKELIFSRKVYFYPDMSKNYQITQYEVPLGENGEVILNEEKKIGITRAHIEEDPAALVHPGGIAHSQYVLVDYNRSGRPLCEIVTEPDMTNPEEAREFLRRLITLLRYLKIFDYKTGVIKADANVSIKESNYTRVEIKNITGFKEIERALQFEIERQRHAVIDGQKIVQETRAWDAKTGITTSLRTKETEADYGYIVDPDLSKIELSDDFVKSVKEKLPLLPTEKAERMIQKKVSKEDALVIANEYALSELFDEVVKTTDPIIAARWIRREVVRVANYNKMEIDDISILPNSFAELLLLIEQKQITDETAKRLLEELFKNNFSPKEKVKTEGLGMVTDTTALANWCKEAVLENDKAVQDYKKGEEKSLHFLVGTVMKKSKGKAKPDDVKAILLKLL